MVSREWSLTSLLTVPPASSLTSTSTSTPTLGEPQSQPVSSANRKTSTHIDIALIILNQPLPPLARLKALWARAAVRICADGGANRLFDATASSLDDRESLLPDIIRGDLDSVHDHVSEFYSQRRVNIEQDHCQDTTDLQKCLEWLCNHESSLNRHHVVVLGALTGRFDQTMSTINFIYQNPSRQIYLLSNENLAFLLTPGHHDICISASVEGPACGLLPISAPVSCSTTNLKWNLSKEMRMEFGKLVSTSNLVVFEQDSTGESTVHVDTDHAVLWTIELSL